MSNWYDDAIFYNLYPLGACNKKRENDYVPTTEGLTRMNDWVAHMESIGCNAVYLGPVFESRTHGYDTTDYRKLDSRLGTNEQFIDFVKNCHDHGIRVVVDAVFNHTGRDFFAFRDLRQKKSDSPYKDWYQGMNFGGNSPDNDGFAYEAWRGHWELPRLNPHNQAVKNYLFDTARMWIREFGVDGIRLDCADCLDFGFMRELRGVCLSERPDFWLMGEIIHGDYTQWANADTLHSVTNYECSKGLYSSHNDGNMHEIAHSLNRQFGPGGIYKGLMLYNFADNHDLNRLADTVKDQRYLNTIYTMVYTMPGLPSVYYGSEWGIHGVTDRVTDWNLRPYIDIRTAHKDDPALMAHITNLARVRRSSPALRRGDYEQLSVASHQLAYRRSTGDDFAIVLINCDSQPAEMTVPATGSAVCDKLTDETFHVSGGRVQVKLAPNSGRILCPAGAAKRHEKTFEKPVDFVWTPPAEPEPAPPPIPEQPAAPPPEPVFAPEPVFTPQPPPTPQPVPPPAPVPPAPGEGVRITRIEAVPAEQVSRHPTYEHEKRRLVKTDRCQVTYYELPPGKSAYPYHFHTAEEEVFYILSGQGLLRFPEGETKVGAGDMIHFPTGEKGAHRLINNHHEPLRYLDFDTVSPCDVSVMPDSRKVNLYNHGKKIYRLGEEADYYDGE